MIKIVEIWQDEVDGMKVNYHHDLLTGSVTIDAHQEIRLFVSAESETNEDDTQQMKALRKQAVTILKNKDK